MSKRFNEIEREVKDFKDFQADLLQQVKDFNTLRDEAEKKINASAKTDLKKIFNLLKSISKDTEEIGTDTSIKKRVAIALARYICDTVPKKGLYLEIDFRTKEEKEDTYYGRGKQFFISKRGFYKNGYYSERKQNIDDDLDDTNSPFLKEEFCTLLLSKTPNKKKKEVEAIINYMKFIPKAETFNRTRFVLPEKVNIKGIELANSFRDEPDTFDLDLNEIVCNGESFTIETAPNRNHNGYARDIEFELEDDLDLKTYSAMVKLKKPLTEVLTKHYKKIKKTLTEIKKKKSSFDEILEPYLILGEDIL